MLVETAEERKADIKADVTTDADASEFVSYVRIPADASQPLAELKLPIVTNGTCDLLQLRLKRTFGDNKAVDIGLLKDQAAMNFSTEGVPESEWVLFLFFC